MRLCTAHEDYVVAADGEVTALRLPSGFEAMPEDISADAAAWATSFASDQRACFVQNHKHVCTVTCVKYQKKPTASSFATASRSRQKKGNWHFEVQVTFPHQRPSPHRQHPQVCHAPAQVYRAGGVRRHRQRGERIRTGHASAHDDVHVLVFGRVAGRSPLQCRLRVPEAVRSRCRFLRTVGRRGTGQRDAWLHVSRLLRRAHCSRQINRNRLHHAAFPCKNAPHRSTRGQEEQRPAVHNSGTRAPQVSSLHLQREPHHVVLCV